MSTVYLLSPSGELYHHGVKGMKWGVRRYQTESGSLTPAGKKRYGDNGSRSTGSNATSIAARGQKAVEARKKSFDELTLKDIQQSQRNPELSAQRARHHVEKYGNMTVKHTAKKVTDRYARIIKRQIENRIVSTALNIALEAARYGLPLLIAAL